MVGTSDSLSCEVRCFLGRGGERTSKSSEQTELLRLLPLVAGAVNASTNVKLVRLLGLVLLSAQRTECNYTIAKLLRLFFIFEIFQQS